MHFMMWLIGTPFICIFADIVVLGFIGYWLACLITKYM